MRHLEADVAVHHREAAHIGAGVGDVPQIQIIGSAGIGDSDLDLAVGVLGLRREHVLVTLGLGFHLHGDFLSGVLSHGDIQRHLAVGRDVVPHGLHSGLVQGQLGILGLDDNVLDGVLLQLAQGSLIHRHIGGILHIQRHIGSGGGGGNASYLGRLSLVQGVLLGHDRGRSAVLGLLGGDGLGDLGDVALVILDRHGLGPGRHVALVLVLGLGHGHGLTVTADIDLRGGVADRNLLGLHNVHATLAGNSDQALVSQKRAGINGKRTTLDGQLALRSVGIIYHLCDLANHLSAGDSDIHIVLIALISNSRKSIAGSGAAVSVHAMAGRLGGSRDLGIRANVKSTRLHFNTADTLHNAVDGQRTLFRLVDRVSSFRGYSTVDSDANINILVFGTAVARKGGSVTRDSNSAIDGQGFVLHAEVGNAVAAIGSNGNILAQRKVRGVGGITVANTDSRRAIILYSISCNSALSDDVQRALLLMQRTAAISGNVMTVHVDGKSLVNRNGAGQRHIPRQRDLRAVSGVLHSTRQIGKRTAVDGDIGRLFCNVERAVERATLNGQLPMLARANRTADFHLTVDNTVASDRHIDGGISAIPAHIKGKVTVSRNNSGILNGHITAVVGQDIIAV